MRRMAGSTLHEVFEYVTPLTFVIRRILLTLDQRRGQTLAMSAAINTS